MLRHTHTHTHTHGQGQGNVCEIYHAAINQYPQGPETAIGTRSSYLTSYFWDRNLYANLQSSFFKDRFQTIIGLFDSRNDRGGNVYDTAGNFLWNGAAPASSGSTLNGVRRPKPVRNTAPSVWATSPSSIT